MHAHRIETTIQADGSLLITDLPFHTGEEVEVIILSQRSPAAEEKPYSLRGTTVTYRDPFKPVADTEWDADQ